MKHDEFVKILKNDAVEKIVSSLLVKIVARFSIFAAGPLNQILVFFLTKIAEIVVWNSELGIFFKYVDFRTDAQGKSFHNALIKNNNAQMNGSEDEKRIAEEELKKTFRSLVKLTS